MAAEQSEQRPRARDTRHFAEELWRRGLHRWAAAFPGWTFLRPELHPDTVEFRLRREGGELRVRVCPTAPDRAPARHAGPSLQAVVLADGGDAQAADGFAQAVAALDRSGRCLRLPRASEARHPDRDGSWRELFIADTCNLRCAFCCEAVRIGRGSLMAWDEITRHLDRFAREGVGVVQLMGGEPSIHPRFVDALAYARSLGLRTYTITNLLRWRSRRFAEAVGPLLDEIMISVHAASATSGAAVTGNAAWWQQFEVALGHARETLVGRIYGATVITRHNVGELDAICDLLLSLGASNWVTGNAVPVAAAPVPALELNLDLGEQRAILPTFEHLRRRCEAAGCRLELFAIPDCVLGPELWDCSSDRVLHDQDFLQPAPADEVSFWSRQESLDRAGRVALGRRYGEACRSCARHGICAGYFAAYLDARGEAELEPVAS